jgi:peptidoglycan/xylan/chitin deacetylase (PgdA/CDA1 family)
MGGGNLLHKTQNNQARFGQGAMALVDWEGMTTKRDMLSMALHRAKALDLILRTRRMIHTPELWVLTYHHVTDLFHDYPYDPHVVNATPADFEAQMELVSRYFATVDIKTLSEAVWDGGRLPPNPLLITFDDGYRSCFDVALPILKRHALTAVFFISTDYVNRRKTFWWDRVNYLIKRCLKPSVTLAYPGPMRFDLSRNRQRAIEELLSVIKSTAGLDLDLFLDGLTAATQVEWSQEVEYKIADELVMSWEQIRELRKAGMDVESHSATHRVLQTLSPEELRRDLGDSRTSLEGVLGHPVTAISYPVGRSIVRDVAIREIIREAGFRLGFSYVTGINADWRKMNPYDIRRMAVEPDCSFSMFVGQLAIPSLAYINPFHL